MFAWAYDEVSGDSAVVDHLGVVFVVVDGFAFGFPVERFKRERLLRQLVLHERSPGAQRAEDSRRSDEQRQSDDENVHD